MTTDTSDHPTPAGLTSTAEEAGLWEAIHRARRWLDDANGTSQAELTMRIFKIAEEYGEATAAWTGVVGQNPRKGITHTCQDVADELGDVAFTALVAAASLGFDPATLLAQVAAKVTDRLPPPAAGEPADPR